MKIFFGVMVLSVISFHSLLADEIILTSGDRLLGTVQEINDQYVVIDTAFAKGIKIQHNLIGSLATDASVNVLFKNGELQTGKLNKQENGLISFSDKEQVVSFQTNEIASNQTLAHLQKSYKVKYSVSLDIGLSRSSGNEDDEDYQEKLFTQARTLHNRYTLEAAKAIEKNNGDKSQDETFGSFQIDHFISEKWYGFGSVSLEENFEELLNLRSTYSLGSGYQFFDKDEISISSEIGFAYVDENFEDNENNRYSGGRWAFDYDQKLYSWINVFHNHEGFFSLENRDHINIRSNSGLKFPLNGHINAKLQANVDWNKSPAQGVATTDKEYLFTLGYEF